MSGLREQKILKAKLSIQECALDLFTKQGYGATTVEQIAEASEVSPSTFFRYFQTKESVVLYDSLDPVIIEAFRAQPNDVSIIRALRNAMSEVFSGLSSDKQRLEKQRSKLMRTIPELQPYIFQELARSIELFADIIAERTHRSSDDLEVRNLAGATIGVGMAALLQVYKNPERTDLISPFDASLAQLEKGLLT
jgi:AcrR family transcriptional regulator